MLGGCGPSFVPALMQTDAHLLLEHQCKLMQAYSVLSTHRRLTTVHRNSQTLK